MAIYYDGLWRKMEERGVSQKMLAQACGIAPNSITRMRQGDFVSLETIDRICTYLGCDYGNIISRYGFNNDMSSSLSNNMKKLSNVLYGYMTSYNETVFTIREKTGLAVNTVRRILKGDSVSTLSISKLLSLGKEFQELLADDIGVSVMKGGNYIEYIPAKPRKVLSYKIFYKLLKCVPEGKLTRREDIERLVAKKLNVDYVNFELSSDDIEWKESKKIRLTIPFWREVSTRGVLRETADCSADLQETMLVLEGHTMELYGEKSKRVENYKEKLFDFESAKNIKYEKIFEE